MVNLLIFLESKGNEFIVNSFPLLFSDPIFNKEILGFLILFTVACIGRIFSSFYLNKKDELNKDNSITENNFMYFLKNKVTFFILT